MRKQSPYLVRKKLGMRPCREKTEHAQNTRRGRYTQFYTEGQYWQQKHGCVMASPSFSGSGNEVPDIPEHHRARFRYVDEIWVEIKFQDVSQFTDQIKPVEKQIKFCGQDMKNVRLVFLDCEISICNRGHLKVDECRKRHIVHRFSSSAGSQIGFQQDTATPIKRRPHRRVGRGSRRTPHQRVNVFIPAGRLSKPGRRLKDASGDPRTAAP